MPPSVEYTAAQGQHQPQDLQFLDMGYYDMVGDRPPLHEPRNSAAMNYGGVGLDVPAQAQVAPPAPVCTDLAFRMHISNYTFR